MPCRYVDVSRLYTQQPLHCGAELVHVYDGRATHAVFGNDGTLDKDTALSTH